MNVSGFVLGLINAAIIGVLLLLAGAIIVWFLSFISITVPEKVQTLYIAFVALVVLYHIVAAIFGLPTWGPIRG